MKRLFYIFLFLSFSYSPQSEGAGFKKAWEWLTGSPHKASIAAARNIAGDDVFPDPTTPSTGQSIANVMDKGIAIAIGAFAGQVFGEFITGGGGIGAGITTGVVVAVSVLYDPILDKATALFGSCKRAFRAKHWKEMAGDGTALVLGAGTAAPWIPLGVSLLVQTLIPQGKCLDDVPYANVSATALTVFGVVAFGNATRVLFKLITSDRKREQTFSLWKQGYKEYGHKELSRTLIWRIPFLLLSVSSFEAINMFARYASLQYFFNCPKGTPTPAMPSDWVAFQQKTSDFTDGIWMAGVIPMSILVASGWKYGGLIQHMIDSNAWSPVLAFLSANFVGIFSGVIVAHTMEKKVLPAQSLLVPLSLATEGLGQLMGVINTATVQYPAATFGIFSGAVLSNVQKVLGPLQVGSGLMIGSKPVLLQLPLAIASTMAVTVFLYPGLERFFNRWVHSDVVDKIDGAGLLMGRVADMSPEVLRILSSQEEQPTTGGAARAQRVRSVNSTTWVKNPLPETPPQI